VPVAEPDIDTGVLLELFGDFGQLEGQLPSLSTEKLQLPISFFVSNSITAESPMFLVARTSDGFNFLCSINCFISSFVGALNFLGVGIQELKIAAIKHKITDETICFRNDINATFGLMIILIFQHNA
jgi:hypothetical protein